MEVKRAYVLFLIALVLGTFASIYIPSYYHESINVRIFSEFGIRSNMVFSIPYQTSEWWPTNYTGYAWSSSSTIPNESEFLALYRQHPAEYDAMISELSSNESMRAQNSSNQLDFIAFIIYSCICVALFLHYAD